MTANRKHIAHFVVCEQVSNFTTPKVCLHMTLDYDIKFVNKEISPFGGLSLFLKMLERCRFSEKLEASGLPLQGSNRGYNPIQLILGLFAGIWCGANCFGHLDVVRYDNVLCRLLGWNRGADHRAYQRYFNKFSQAVNQRVFGELYHWFFSQLVFDNYTLDFDSTVMVREGCQEGAVKGYNPKRPGRPSHHPLLAFVSDVRMIANYWLRPGNTSATSNYLAFLEDTLSRLTGKHVGLVRMDSGFFSKDILYCLESKHLHYIIACRFNNRIKYSLTHQQAWTELAEGLDIAETVYQAEGWGEARRIVMVRQEIEKRPKAAGKVVKQLELFEDEAEYGKYRFSCYVTNLDLPARIVYDSYRGRADSENRIKELKADFSLDEFVSHNFWATEACGNFIIMAYNFMSLFRHALINSDKKQFLKTIRYELLSTPAYLGSSKGTKDKHILYLARSLKTRKSFLTLWNKLKDFSLPYDTEKS